MSTYHQYWQVSDSHSQLFYYIDLLWKQQISEEDDWLPPLIQQHGIRSVLDVGCATGRMFSVWRKLGLDAVGIDFSDCVLPEAKRQGDIHNVHIEKLDITESVLPRSFDLVFSTQVLLHIPPTLIEKAFKNMTAMSSGYVAIVTWHDPSAYGKYKDYDPELHNNSFSHDYPALFKANNLSIIDTMPMYSNRNTAWFLKRN